MRRIITKRMSGQEAVDLFMTGVFVKRVGGTRSERQQVFVTVAHDAQAETSTIRNVSTGEEVELPWSFVEFA